MRSARRRFCLGEAFECVAVEFELASHDLGPFVRASATVQKRQHWAFFEHLVDVVEDLLALARFALGLVNCGCQAGLKNIFDVGGSCQSNFR